MSLQKIKGSYDAVFSLGHLCLPAMQMKKFNLRPFSGVFDWVGSPQLSKVNQLIQTRFTDFLNMNNLRPDKYLSPTDLYVYDFKYDIGFNHDFKTDKNTLTHLGGYPEVKEKYDRRINRFLEKLSSSKRILFIRTEKSEANFQDVQQLEKILMNMVAHDFQILLIHHKDIQKMTVVKSPFAKVTIVELPNKEIWNENDPYWAKILHRVRLMK
ncbi:DUF1796 family putative cysteine peptidase [Bacillus andreraoultii]|uniref:DUF1796 family putative cysteine peptidase n=1 Tax=Bacillus andreraoultii TaxID=1499685 RepID=UPI00053A17DD|nr:DUF1796 family putative cysteine peptidase [Bacillus andreraoultii]